MLRDLIGSSPQVATWPCDEINYLWRHGNRQFPSDAFGPEMATDAVREFMLRQFVWVQKKYSVPLVLEKTCANSLRVGFVERIVPDARYVFIHRHGVDAALSAIRRWRAGLDARYLIKKARFVPLADLPYYAGRYLSHRLRRLMTRTREMPWWGPVIPDVQNLRQGHDLVELCALQWQCCVTTALNELAKIDQSRVLKLAYEELVTDKHTGVRRLADFLDLDCQQLQASGAFDQISAAPIGRGRVDAPRDTLERMHEILQPTLQELGYDDAQSEGRQAAV